MNLSSFKKEGITKRWISVGVFKTDKDAMNFLKIDGCWTFRNVNHTKEGVVKFFRCNRVGLKKKICGRNLKLVFNSSSNNFILYRNSKMHNCNLNFKKNLMGLSDELKSDIENLHEKNFEPKDIVKELTLRYDNPPNIYHIKKYIARFKVASCMRPTISLAAFEGWLIENSIIPSDDYQAFIVNFMTDNHNYGVFRFMASSKALLKLALQKNLVIHADIFNKLDWQGYPVFVIGTSDLNKEFHILGVAVCSGETTVDFEFIFQSLKNTVKTIYNVDIQPKVLVTDTSYSIQNACKKVFGTDVAIKVCWELMRNVMENKIWTLVSIKNQQEVLADIDQIQLSENKNSFIKACFLFRKKWKHEYAFLPHFRGKCYKINQHWYEGVSLNTPSTNNGLACMKKLLLNERAFSENLDLIQFCNLLIEMLNSFSAQYKTDNNKFATNVVIDLNIWAAANEWSYFSKKANIEVYSDDTLSSIIPANERFELNHKDLLDGTESNFDEYMRKKNNSYNLSLPLDHTKWIEGECSCPVFMKRNICKHLVGTAIRLKLTVPPPEAKTINLHVKKKKGKSSLTNKLIIR